jgi:hypothetical protein
MPVVLSQKEVARHSFCLCSSGARPPQSLHSAPSRTGGPGKASTLLGVRLPGLSPLVQSWPLHFNLWSARIEGWPALRALAMTTGDGSAHEPLSVPLHIRSKNGIGRQIQSRHFAIHSGNLVYHGLKFCGFVRRNGMLFAPCRNSFKGFTGNHVR